ncbi:S-adenosyl-L-methionine-dependent methyltransferase [Thelephora ganbajun]|uniref:S-adenosyl-L-methionine-dependent methyltransferase n=1 Tax=Thelephora ganbajun TaxID=370292 RepID=A0ACB6ZVD3_THEGA|nr:S-adenosyl-L-methionine-dependent methyltransferase [Thelephora ganbajun]
MDAEAEQPFQLASVFIGRVLVILSQSFALLAYKRALTPLYSSIPASSYISYVTIASSVLGSIVAVPTSIAALVYGSLLAAAPNTAFYAGKYIARWRDPVLGPIMTHFIVLVPILVSGMALLQSVHHNDTETTFTRMLRLPLMFFIFPSIEPLWNSIEQLQTIPATEIFIALAAAVFSFWVGYAYVLGKQEPRATETPAHEDKGKGKQDVPKKVPASTPAKSWVQKIPKIPSPLTYFILMLLTSVSYHYSPSIHSHFRTGQLKAPYIHPSGNLTILSSKQSITGVIVVGETARGNEAISRMRYLRASHSLLGGVWTNERAISMDTSRAIYDAAGNRLGDSIYTAFILQEAVRLINSTSRGDDWSGSEALIIGLGTGIVTTALKSHGFETTVVEIDPAVYDAARTYFGLPDPGEGRVFLQDARGFTWDRKRKLETGEDLPKFDVVIHDVFSGGGLPGHLFTLEFWNDLKDVMKEDGVVVVASSSHSNFVGTPGSKSSRAVLSTLLHAFGQCRGFYDSMQELSDEKSEEFMNIVFFCTPVPETTKRMSLRPPRDEDYLGSYLRRHVFQHLLRRELAFDTILGQANEDHNSEARVLLTDDENPLSGWQDEGVPNHWQREFTDPISDVFYLSGPLAISVLNDELNELLSSHSPSFASSVSDTRLLMILILSVMKEVLPDICWETF